MFDERTYGGVVAVLTEYLGKDKLNSLQKFQFLRNWQDIETQKHFLSSLGKKLKYDSIF